MGWAKSVCDGAGRHSSGKICDGTHRRFSGNIGLSGGSFVETSSFGLLGLVVDTRSFRLVSSTSGSSFFGAISSLDIISNTSGSSF